MLLRSSSMYLGVRTGRSLLFRSLETYTSANLSGLFVCTLSAFSFRNVFSSRSPQTGLRTTEFLYASSVFVFYRGFRLYLQSLLRVRAGLINGTTSNGIIFLLTKATRLYLTFDSVVYTIPVTKSNTN